MNFPKTKAAYGKDRLSVNMVQNFKLFLKRWQSFAILNVKSHFYDIPVDFGIFRFSMFPKWAVQKVFLEPLSHLIRKSDLKIRRITHAKNLHLDLFDLMTFGLPN